MLVPRANPVIVTGSVYVRALGGRTYTPPSWDWQYLHTMERLTVQTPRWESCVEMPHEVSEAKALTSGFCVSI